MSKRMSTSKKVLIGGVVVAAVGGIGYFIWKKMKAAEEEQEPSFQAQSSAMSGMGAHYNCPTGYSAIEPAGYNFIGCISAATRALLDVTVASSARCPRGYVHTGWEGSAKRCTMSGKTVAGHCLNRPRWARG